MVETPGVIIDARKVTANIQQMQKLAQASGIKLRPHVKTHKIPKLAEQQLDHGAIGITTAKVGEAEVMAEHGIQNIFIAYPLVGEGKIARALKLSRQIELTLAADSLEGAGRISEQAVRQGMSINLRLEIDTGLKRTGVSLDEALPVAKQIAELPGIVLNGIFTFKGAVLEGKSTLDLQAAGLEEGRMMVRLASEMRAAGLTIDDVSVGSTPTALYAAQVEGVTEIRPGTYIFQDRMQERLGVCQAEQWAAAVLVTVVSVSSQGDWVVIDGGSKTFATDVQPNQAPLELKGFGTIIGHPEAVLERMNEEHGMIRWTGPNLPKVGDTLKIVPNHICSTINLHNYVYMDYGDHLERVEVSARGKVQ
ncbi:alanine racemase [Paenibacillus senegalensis]|uniref:alanine racemase n=1 Tax=Paenibacillus senegalensis TaxID=1465766 RepID=UPI000289EAFC|nr:alanine racemase [Paenibacillus senegalensis]